MTVELKDGQVYRWRWADAARDADRGPYRSYHCKSCIAVVKNGMLIDTFWFDMSSEHAIDPEKVELTYLCDTSWPTIPAYNVPYYDREDIADTRHSNHSGAPIYLRPGAVKSAERIMEEIERREEDARSTIRTAGWRLEELAKARALLDEGKVEEARL